MRVIVADDETLLREGLARLLRGWLRRRRQGRRRPRAAARGPAHRPRRRHRRHQDAADTHRRRPCRGARDPLAHPDIGVLVLSHYLESRYAMRLLDDIPSASATCSRNASPTSPSRRRAAAHRRRRGVLDPTIVARLVNRPREQGPLAELTDRERQVLALIAEGRSNQAIGERLFLSPKTVETHIRQIFPKLGLEGSPDSHRRVLAVLTFLRS